MSSVTRFARALSIAVCGILLAGFGVCGAFGTVTGLRGMMFDPTGRENIGGLLLGFGVTGLVIALVCALILRKLWRTFPSSDA